MVSIRQLYYLQRDGQHKAIILSSARWSAYGNYIECDNNLQCDGQHKAIILSSARWSAYGNYIERDNNLQRDGQHKVIILSVTTIFSAMVSVRQLC